VSVNFQKFSLTEKGRSWPSQPRRGHRSKIAHGANAAETQELLIGSDKSQVEDLRRRGEKTVGGIVMKIELLCREDDFMSEGR